MTPVLINGEPLNAPDGSTILDALRVVGIPIPALCHDDRLVPSGACRACLVEIEGQSRPAAACATPVQPGMVIRTDTDALREYRRSVLALLAARYPADAVRRFPGKPFHQLLAASGLAGRPSGADAGAEDDGHPFITVDMSRCIRCYRCVRICDEVQGQDVWQLNGRGAAVAIVPDGPNLRQSSCVSCGACVDTCPTGALEDAPAVSTADVTGWIRTVCPYCGTGCELLAGTRDGRIVSVRPALDAPVNRGHLCVKGRYGFSFTAASDRVTEPMVRRGSGWQPVSWEEAIAFVAERLRGLADRHGPDCVGILGSARATNEDNYVVQKFARVVLGTNNVDCCARVCHAPSAAGLKSTLGVGLATNSFDDIERARAILVWGANPTENHPIVGARIRQAARAGARLVVVDPRRTELAEIADQHLALRPGTDVALINAVAHCLVQEGMLDAEFVERETTGLDEFTAFLQDWTPERVAGICGVDASAIRRAARLYGASRPAISFHGLGITEHAQGTEAVMALVNLALLTGNIGIAGGGINPLRGQNNVQGAAHMGCDPATLPGSVPLERGREAVERAWQATVPRTRGRHLLEMMDAAAEGRLQALWAIGYDVLLTNPNATRTADALGRLDLVIVQDLFMTETARRFGTVFLPACSTFEHDGTFMNAERRIQRVRRAIEPAGASRADWEIVCAVAAALGKPEGFGFDSAESIWNEVRALCDGARGMSYARLDAAGLQWPCPDESHPGTSILHATGIAGGARVGFRSIAWHEAGERPTPEYPFTLVTGRALYQFNAGTMSARSGLNALRESDRLDAAAEDLERLGLRESDRVRVTSAHGQAVLPIHASAAMRPGQLFATFHTPDAFVNTVTGSIRDPITGTPDYKVTAVRVERA
jgi:formate dehydrogenase major subunit